MAYDANREVVVMLGGDNDAHDEAAMRQLWEWDGQQWNRRADVTGGPQGQVDPVEMAYDSWRGVIVVRVRRSQTPPETWEYDGQTWTLRSTAGPQSIDSVSMAFDSRRGLTVLHGRNPLGTWEWDGNVWTLRNAGPADGAFELAFDENRGVTVAFGITFPNLEGQTWEWDGESWELASVGGPPRRDAHGMAYDSLRQEVVIFGAGWATRAMTTHGRGTA